MFSFFREAQECPQVALIIKQEILTLQTSMTLSASVQMLLSAGISSPPQPYAPYSPYAQQNQNRVFVKSLTGE